MPAIAELWAVVMPDTSKVAAGIAEGFRRADPIAADAGRRWGQEIQRGIGEAKVKLTADTAEAKAKIDEASKDKKSTVEVDADTAKARVEIDEVARDRKANITVDSNALAASGTRAATSVTNSLSGAMPAVGSALSTALIAGGVSAAAGVAAALSGAIGLIPAGLGGGVAVLGTLVTGLDGVRDAWDAAGKAADSATKDSEEKAKAVASAQKSLRDAVLDEANAQRDVANARKDARQQLEDLNVSLRGGVLDEKSAILDAAAARRDLAQGRYKDSIEAEQAQLRVQQADQRVLEAHERNVELQGKAADANQKGIDGSDQVVAANQRLAKSHDDVAEAQRNLADAQKPSSNQESLIESMAKLSPVAQGFVNTLVGLKPAWQSLKFGVQDSLLAGIGPEIVALTTQYLPTLKSAMGDLAGTMNAAFKDVGAWLSKPETLAVIQQIVANIGTSFGEWAKSIVPFSQAFLTITQVGSSFLPGLAQMITNGANAFNDFIQKAAASGQLGQWMQTGIDALHALLQLVPIVGQMFMALAPMAVPALQEIGQLLQGFTPLLQATANLLAEHPGLITAVVVAFATWKSITVVDSVLTGLSAIRAALTAMPAEAEAAGASMTTALGPILGTLTAAATALALWNSHGDSAPTNIGSGADERQRKLNAGKAYADEHGGKVPDGYQQWLDKGGPLPSGMDKYYVQGAAPGTPFYDAQGRPLNAQGKPFGPSLPGPYVPNMPKSTVPGALAPSAVSGYNWDALAQAEAGGDWANKSNPKYSGGLQFDQQTWMAYKPPDAPPVPADATKEQQIAAANNAIAAGRTPQSLWPQNYQKLGIPAITPGVAMPSAMPSTGSLNFTGALPDVRGAHPQEAYALQSIQQLFPWAQLTAGNYDHPKDQGWHGRGQAIDIGGGTPEQQAALSNWLLQFAPEIEELIHSGPGVSQNVKSGKLGPAIDMPGSVYNSGQAGYHGDHVHLAVTDQQAQAFIAAVSGGGMPGYNYPSAAGLPTIASPYGVSQSGMPLGTQQSPMYVQPAATGGQQLGQDFLSGFLEIFGLDGTIAKSPLDSGLFKGFKGLMSALTGGGQGGGLPASAFGAMGGDGAALPMGGGGGGDIFGGLMDMGANALKGVVPQAFGDITPGGPVQAPTQDVAMPFGNNTFADSGGGNASLPSSYTPGLAKPQAPVNNHVDNSVTINNPMGQDHFTSMWNTAQGESVSRMRGTFRGRVPGFSI